MYSVQPKLLKHCTLTVGGVSIIYYYLHPIREKSCTECLNTLEQQAPIEISQNTESSQIRRKIEADPNRRSSADD